MNRNTILYLLLLAVILASCRSRSISGEQKIITVSILPEKTFVRKIAGDEYVVNVLIPPGASPAAYSLSPLQMAAIAKSVVWFRIGHIGFEYSWGKNISQVNTSMKTVDLSEGLDLIKKENPNPGSPDGGYDPHTWLSPACVKLMAEKILDVLSGLNPKQAHTYKINYLRFAEEIDQLNIQLKNTFRDFHGKKILVYHPTMSYFARDYGLQQVSLESGGKEPTPQTMVNLIKTAKEEGIRVIYIQSELDIEQARVFGEETGGQIIRLNPLDPDWSENLLSMANIIRDNLK